MNIAITTIDNPYNPLTDFKNWFKFDSLHNYNTCSLLAKFAKTSEMFSDYENKLETSHAIDEIIRINPELYKAIVE